MLGILHGSCLVRQWTIFQNQAPTLHMITDNFAPYVSGLWGLRLSEGSNKKQLACVVRELHWVDRIHIIAKKLKREDSWFVANVSLRESIPYNNEAGIRHMVNYLKNYSPLSKSSISDKSFPIDLKDRGPHNCIRNFDVLTYIKNHVTSISFYLQKAKEFQGLKDCLPHFPKKA